MRYSEEVIQKFTKFTKFIGKQPCRTTFLNKGRRTIKKRLKQSIFKNTPRRLFWKIIFSSYFFWQFFTRIPEIIGTFHKKVYRSNNWWFFSFCCSCLVLIPWSQGILMGLAKVRKSDYIDKVFMLVWTLRKWETFYALYKVCVAKLSNILGVSKNQFQSF